MLHLSERGRLAQLGERIVRNDEVGGSNPPPSTKTLNVYVVSDRLQGEDFSE